jgi:hypothetical protein
VLAVIAVNTGLTLDQVRAEQQHRFGVPSETVSTIAE